MTLVVKRLSAVATLVASLTWASGCGSKSPTAPSVPSSTPVIASIAPASLTAGTNTQVLSITGSGFSAVSLVLRAPDGSTTTYPPTTMTDQTSTSFKASVTMPVPGSWAAIVRNSDGVESAPTTITVTPQGPPTNPQILSVAPGVLVSSSTAQSITVTGVNFRAGLSLIVRSAFGAATTYNGASLSAVTATSLTALVMLNASGPYTLIVQNADGLESGVFALTVNATPIVSSVTGTLTASSDPQTFEVFGLHFLPGLAYVLKGPDTGAVLHGSADVTELTSVHFKGVGVFSVPGDWSITVINANGVSSTEFAFRIR